MFRYTFSTQLSNDRRLITTDQHCIEILRIRDCRGITTTCSYVLSAISLNWVEDNMYI